MPPLTVASLATISDLAAGDAADAGDEARARGVAVAMSNAASGESSRNGDPRSSSRSMRSRTGSLPCARCRSTYFAPPPSARRADALAQSVDELLHAIAVGREDGVRGVDLRVENDHLPAAAVGLEAARGAAPDRVHAVISAPHRSHTDLPGSRRRGLHAFRIVSVMIGRGRGLGGVVGAGESGMWVRIIASASAQGLGRASARQESSLRTYGQRQSRKTRRMFRIGRKAHPC